MAQNDFPQDTNPYPNDTLNLLAAKIVRILKDGGGGGGGGGGLTDAELRASPVSIMGEVETIGQRGGLIDRRGEITLGGTSQQLADANGGRLVFFIQNLSIENLWLNFDDPATADGDSIKILPNGYWEAPSGYLPTSPINILGATTGSKWVAKEA